MKRVMLGFFAIALSTASGQGDEGLKLNSQGLAASDKGNHVEAERLFREAGKIWGALGPSYAAHLASTQTNLAQALSGQGKRSEAVEVLEAAVAQFRRSPGIEHLHSLTAMNILAANYLMQGEDSRAAALFEEAIPVERRLHSKDAQLARSLSGLSLVRLRAGRVNDAMPLSEEALTVALSAEGESSLDAALVYSNVAEVHRMAGRPERALPLYRKAYSIYERNLGPGHPRLASILSQLGLLEMGEGNLSSAERLMTQSLGILSKACPDCVFEQTVSETNLGLLRMKQQKYAEADRLLTHVVSMMEQHWGTPGPLLAATLRELARVREKQRRPDDAAKLHKRADLILSFR